MVIARPTALQIEAKGRPLIIRLDGEEITIETEGQVFDLVGGLDRACRDSRDGLWRARVRLGVALLELERVLPGNTVGRNSRHFGINPRTARRAKQLARAIADETGRVDEQRLRAEIADYENRRRDTTGVTKACEQGGEVAGRVTPEDVDLSQVTYRKIEQATGLRSAEGAPPTTGGAPSEQKQTQLRGAQAPTPQRTGGVTRAAGPLSISEHRPAPRGEQMTLADLLEFTDAISKQMEDLITLDPEELAGRVGKLGGEQRAQLSRFLSDLNTDNNCTDGGRSTGERSRGEG